MHSFAPRVLITAGPTHEPIDSVRYIGNRSSGRMGIALVEASVARGWPTTLLLGPTPLTPPNHSHLRVMRFQTAADLQRLLRELWPSHDLLIMAAAVADYRPKPAGLEGRSDSPPAKPQKIKRTDRPLHLELEPTPDLLADLASLTRPDQIVIGFALEPADQLMASAREKLLRKKVHGIVANPLETMDSPQITGTLVMSNGEAHPAPAQLPKTAFADWLLDRVLTMLPRQ